VAGDTGLRVPAAGHWDGSDEVIILRRDRPVARLVGIDREMTPFVSRAALRAQLPPMRQSADDDVREAQALTIERALDADVEAAALGIETLDLER